MATGDNAIVPLFEPGTRITAAVTAAVSAGTFVSPSGDFQQAPGINVAAPMTGGNLIQVATTGAGLKALGVAVYDAVTAGDVLAVITGAAIVVPVVSSGAIAYGTEVQSNASGQAVAFSTGIKLGLAVSSAVSNVVYVKLYA